MKNNLLESERLEKKDSTLYSNSKLKTAYMKRGGINIKPENKGKFTASAKKAGMSVQGYASKIMANKEKYSPTLVKRANFAKNAAKWKKK